MYYDFAVVIPAGTTTVSPHTEDLRLEKGTIHHVEVRFEAGCQREAHCKLERWGHQAFPKLPSLSFCSEDDVIELDDHFPLDAEPYILKFIGWSPDANYDHTITIRVGILYEDYLMPVNPLVRALDKFFKMIPGFK